MSNDDSFIYPNFLKAVKEAAVTHTAQKAKKHVSELMELTPFDNIPIWARPFMLLQIFHQIIMNSAVVKLCIKSTLEELI